MTHIDETSSTWDCCGAWECVCGIPDEAFMYWEEEVSE